MHQSGPRWRQVGTKLGAKIDPKWSTPSDLGGKNGVSHRFGVPKMVDPTGSWWSKRPRPKNEVRYPFFDGILEPSWLPFGAVVTLRSPLWSVLGRLGVVLGHLKSDQKIYIFRDRILMRYWLILRRKMEASWDHFDRPIF